MDSLKISAFLQGHWFWVTFVCGLLILCGAIFNWRWMCEPTSKSYGQRYSQGTRRVVFFFLGLILTGVSALHVLKALGKA